MRIEITNVLGQRAVVLHGDDEIEVVGWSHHEEELEEMFEALSTRPGVQVSGWLVPETSNPYDATAVAVMFGNVEIGHLSRDVAAHWHPVLRRMSMQHGANIACQIHVNDDRGEVRAFVRLPTPETNLGFIAPAAPPPPPLPAPTWPAFTGSPIPPRAAAAPLTAKRVIGGGLVAVGAAFALFGVLGFSASSIAHGTSGPSIVALIFVEAVALGPILLGRHLLRGV